MERPSFAQALRKARQEAGLSQAALAERAGLTPPYISLLEGGHRRPPTPPLIDRLAKALGIKAEPLSELAALERTPGPVRRRLEGLDRERGKVHRARDRILSTTLFNLAQRPEALAELAVSGDEALWFRGIFGRLSSKLRGVTSAREARARSAELLDPLPSAERDRLMEALPDVLHTEATPAGAQAEAASQPTEAPAVLSLEVRDGLAAQGTLERQWLDARGLSQGAFLWRLASDEAYPRLEAGDLLLVEPARAAADGDLVAVRHEGRDLVRVFRRRGADEVRLDALRADVPPLRLSAAAFAPVGVVTRVLRTLA